MEFDIKNLDQAYQEETGQTKGQVETDNRRSMSELGVRGVEVDDDGIADTFCAAWPKAKAFFNFAFMFGAWMPGMSNMVVMARGVIKAIDDAIVPAICDVPNNESGERDRNVTHR